MADPDDKALVAAAAGGDSDAFAALYRRHRDRVFRVAAGIMCDREAALDVTQDVFCKLVGVLGRYDGRAAFTTWLHRVTVNACYDVLRRRTAIATADPHLASGRPESTPEADTAAAVDVRAALALLPLDQRSVVVLVDMVGFTYADVADALDVAVGTVKSRLARGRLRLAELLDPGNTGSASHRRSSGGPGLG